MFNGETEALPLKIKDAASVLLRVTWQEIRTITVEDGMVTFRFRSEPHMHVRAEAKDLPNLVRLIRGE